MDIERAVVDLQKQMAAAEEQHKTLFRRIDKAEELNESVHSLALSVQKLTDSLTNTNKTVTDLCTDVDELKAKPGKRWETLAMDVMKVIVGGVIGFLFVKLGIG